MKTALLSGEQLDALRTIIQTYETENNSGFIRWFDPESFATAQRNIRLANEALGIVATAEIGTEGGAAL